MEYKRLGLTDLNISRIGFGCWAIGGHGYGKVNDSDSITAIKRALDLGVNFFDTADVYGFGYSEEVLVKALGKNKSKVVISTKFGVGWDERGRTFKDSSPKRLMEALDGSLRRLQLDCIPLYQIHWHDGVTPLSEIMIALRKCKRMGKIRYIGCTNFTFPLISEAHKTERLESLQTLYNIIQRESENDTLKCVSSFKMGIIAYEVLGRGLFSGKYTADSEFGSGDTRERDKLQADKFKAYIVIAKTLGEIGEQYGKTALQVAIRWVLDNSNVICALVGVKNPQQIEENADVFGWALSQEDKKRIEVLTKKIAGAMCTSYNMPIEGKDGILY